ncbi:hypothetical protein QR680_013237 [Steinernema hermaphroditum]|uniref:Uncharacterized protein n=1 Tax=Steinernema hermaphroditum TaxID=289476 RepID=A0AA39I746_9BILA|nr:hypothetical protein QR680_013237 [Steinernema hermaphroditum]
MRSTDGRRVPRKVAKRMKTATSIQENLKAISEKVLRPSLSTTHIDISPSSRDYRTQSSSTMSAVPIPHNVYRRQSVDSAVVIGSPTRRFFETFREKMHLRGRRNSHREERDDVDPLEHLAFPPPCDVPPEVLAPLGCSVPSSDPFFAVGDFRSRSRSEVPASTVLPVGYGSQRASGGVLVMFPPNSSASSSTNSSSAALHNNNYVVPPGRCHRRHASVCCDGENRENNCGEAPPKRQFVLLPAMAEAEARGPRPRSFSLANRLGLKKTAIGNCRAGGSKSARGACPSDHPLYVDTQLANNPQNPFDKKRSPVAHMVDLVKGRSRTNSMMSSTSPLCFTVDAAAMANTNSPIRSPAIRPRTATTGNRYSRAVVLQGMHSQRSLDESASPVALGHTALLVREVSVPPRISACAKPLVVCPSAV